MPCTETILSNNTYDFIVANDEEYAPFVQPICIQPINDIYSVWYFDRDTVPPLSINRYSYSSIPKCFFLMDSTSLDVSGILSIQNQPTLSLKGQGVFVGIIDTGIDYTNDLFKDTAGQSRIYSIWDQTISAGPPPQGFLYGVEYTREDINQALQSENPRDIVPETDTNGHGTFLASLAAGSADPENDFIGAAPLSELIVVKLKEAKQNLRDFYYFPEDEPLYQENDIMAGVAYLESVAERENRPLVILLGVGSNQGSHTGTGPLSTSLNLVGLKIGRAVVVPAGNQAIAQHHFYGEAKSMVSPVAVEINVEENVAGFCMELWTFAPELVRVVVQSPTGQQSQGGFPITEETQTTNFIFENTILTIDYRIAGRESGDLLVFFRFSQPAEGIWTVLVYPENAITGAFHMWLPIQPAVSQNITFVRPNPDTTITTPSAAEIPITVGGYDGLTGAHYIQSGRGFNGIGQVKPDFCAPCVDVSGAGRAIRTEGQSGDYALIGRTPNNYVTLTGTSVAAAITAGASALVLEWGIGRKNAPTMNCVQVKNLLIRGCQRESNPIYPNTEWGYGKLDVYNSFMVLR